MGCSTQNQEIQNIPLKDKIYEPYPEISPDIYHINFYKLNWKVTNVICYYALIEQETHSKKDISDFFILLSKTNIIEIQDIEFDLEVKNFLYYVFLDKGVFITRNYKKVNYFMKKYINKLIKIDFVNLSEEFLVQNEYFSLHEIKKQSKYFFELNMKEIDFTERNKLIEEGKNNDLSDNEVDLNDESFSEEKNNDIDKKFENEISDNENQIINEKENNIEKNKQNLKNWDFIQLNNFNKNKNINNNSIFEEKKSNNIFEESNENDHEEENDNRYKEIDLFLKSKNINIKSNYISDYYEEYNDVFENNKLNEKDNLNLSVYNSKLELSNKNKINTHQLDTKNEEEKEKGKNITETEDEKNNIKENFNEKNDSNQNNNINAEIDKPINSSKLYKKSPFKIVNKNTLIINTSELNENINRNLETFFYSFHQNNNPINELEHIDYYNESLEEKDNDNDIDKDINNIVNSINKNKKKGKTPNDYILIYSNQKIPYEKRISLNDIKKVFFINCDFSKKSIFYLKQFIGMLMQYKNLNKFGIYCNKMKRNFKGWKFFRALFRENFNIRWVSFKKAYLDDKIFTLMAEGLILKRIRYLNISKNNLSNACMYFLNELLLKNQTLIHLDISYNKHISFKGIQFILNGIKFHSNLTNLIFNHINLNNCGPLIVELLKDNKNIKKLCIRKGQFDIKDIKDILNEIKQIECSLTYLDISSNKTPEDAGIKEIAKLIQYNKSLKHLGLDNLNLNLDNYLPIFQSIYKNRTIESYSLDMNKGLPLKGLLNFFLKNPQVNKISVTPWNIKKEPNKKFSREQINLLQLFHSKAPKVKIVNFDLRQRKSVKYYSHKY